VGKAVENGEIDSMRYRSYLSILNDENTKYR
jgi:putative ribosome biogenesis GTPase RsgA